jgi:non-specific serine/threonine protein kinase
MSKFRPALESFIDGNTDLPALERELRSDLTHEPSQAPEIGTLIETSYRSGRIAGAAYLALVDVVRSTTPPLTSHSAETRLSPSAGRVSAPSIGDDETEYRPAPANPGPAIEPLVNTVQTAHWAGTDSRAPQPGDVIKDRFVLEDVIGKGGMGVVFRARDKRKEEAQDRHPYAALKVLNEDFKRHPESLKALQREARKAQNLAHPNIVTVYDFDRDGSNVFMVMELLEGEPLDRYIRRLDGAGLTVLKAMPIIRALCGALAYAHEHEVVHSDFKPANAFVTRSGAIKVFDFGIARAAKHQGDDTGTQTLFDPGTLGALTPAYASCEMLEGGEPDLRDDIYALGCVVYELLTGIHPFGGKSAVHARESKLKPEPIKGLTGRQWRALRRSLAYERTARTVSVPRFLEEISPEKRSPARWIAAAIVLVVSGVAGAYLLPGYVQRQRADELAALIRSGKPGSIGQALPRIEALAPDVRATMLLDEGMRTALIKDFNERIEAVTDSGKQQYDYPRAAGLMAQLTRLFPDSQAVAQIGERLTARKNDQVKLQSDRFDRYLQQGWLVAAQHAENASVVLAVIAQIDPHHPLLTDPRLPSAYAEQAQLALRQSDAALAQLLVTAGLAVAPSDSTLKDLNDRVSRELDTQRRAARLADLHRKLTQEFSATTRLAEFDAVHADLSMLQSQSPQDPELIRVQRRLQELMDQEVRSLSAGGSDDNARALLARYADLLSPQFIESKRVAFAGEPGSSAVAGLQADLDALLKAPGSGDDWDARVGAQLAKLSAYLSPSDTYLLDVRNTAAASHLATATALRMQGRLSEADRSLQRARTYSPALPAITLEEQQVARMEAEQDARDRQDKRTAELVALRQKLLDQSKANEVVDAAVSLRELRAGLPAEDPFLSTTAPMAIAAAYIRLAANAIRDGHPAAAAVSLVDRALELDRGNAQFVALREKYAQQSNAIQSAKPEATAPSPAPSTAKTEPAAQVASQVSLQAASQPSVPSPTTGCSAALAGYGTRSRGVCFDALPSGRGPELVVVPAGGSVARPFAIGRFEISASDYAEFCKQSGKCPATTAQADLPLTAVTIAAASQYVEWLSAATGFVYRLPTEAEWMYVANAPGGSADRDFNCIVEINGQKIRGFSLNSVRSGKPNGWGLYNLVGNAQEWVKTADGWSARGGAFSDPISQCGPALARSSAGDAAANTGFRVLRELR